MVGASGCGKSTLARHMLALERPDSGSIIYNDKDLFSCDNRELKEFRKRVQMVFQDSILAVNNRMKIKDIIMEPLNYLTDYELDYKIKRVEELVEVVGLPLEVLEKKPGRLSGGQLQRICIARALSIKPKLIVLDESLSSLDTVLQKQLISLLSKLQREESMSFLFITHDLRLVHKFCSRVVVLDSGYIVEDRCVSDDMEFKSKMGQNLKRAILPPMPIIN